MIPHATLEGMMVELDELIRRLDEALSFGTTGRDALPNLLKDCKAKLEQLRYEQIEHDELGCHVAKTGIYAQDKAVQGRVKEQGNLRPDSLTIRTANCMLNPDSMPCAALEEERENALRYRYIRSRNLGELLALYNTTDMSDIGLDYAIDKARQNDHCRHGVPLPERCWSCNPSGHAGVSLARQVVGLHEIQQKSLAPNQPTYEPAEVQLAKAILRSHGK